MSGAGGVMVFRPTLEQFSDFTKYVTYMESQGAAEYGVAKIIPPEGWKACKDLQKKLKERNIIIPSPVYQEISSTHVGIYQQLNIEQESINLESFESMARSEQYGPPKGTLEELEEKYWKSLTFNPPLYGADVMGSLYDEDVKIWNIDKLGDVLDNVCTELSVDIPGVNSPYLYFGMWKSTFPWHVEDMDLYAINYLHYGEPKFWYAIPQKHGGRFETMIRGVYPESFKLCPEFLRHKMTIVSPKNLGRSGIPVNRMVQRQGEFMITFPRGYHSGFNLGYNAAESTNFALHRWVELGKKSRLCMCFSDSVSINMDQFIDTYNECYNKNVEKSSQSVPVRKVNNKSKLKRKVLSDKKKKAISRRRRHKHNMSKTTRVKKKKVAKKLLKMYTLHSIDKDLDLDPPVQFDVILDSEEDNLEPGSLPSSLQTFLPKKHLSVKIPKTPQSLAKKSRSLLRNKNLKNMLKYNWSLSHEVDNHVLPCTKGVVDDTTISISEIFNAVEGGEEGGEEEIECELEEVPDIFIQEPMAEDLVVCTKVQNEKETADKENANKNNADTASADNTGDADNAGDADDVVVLEAVPQTEFVCETPETGNRVFCPTIGVDDPVVDIGPIRKAKRKRKRKPSFGSSGPRLNQKLVSSVGYIHCRYPKESRSKKAEKTVKKPKAEKLKPDTDAHPAVVKMRRVAWIFDHNYTHCKVKVQRIETEENELCGIESSSKAKSELTYYLPNCIWNRNILSLEHNLFVCRNYPKNKDVIKEKVYMFEDQGPDPHLFGKHKKRKVKPIVIEEPEVIEVIENDPISPISPIVQPAEPARAATIPSYGQHKNYKLNPLHGNNHLPIDMTQLSALQREEYIDWVIKTGQRTADFRVWGHHDEDDGRIYKTKLSNELNHFTSSIECNTLDPVVKAAFIKELTNMQLARQLPEEQPDIKPIIPLIPVNTNYPNYPGQNQQCVEAQMRFVAPLYDRIDYRLGPRYIHKRQINPLYPQYSSTNNKPLYKVSSLTNPPAPPMSPIKVKDNYGPVVAEDPIFTYSPPKHHPPGYTPTPYSSGGDVRVRAVNSLRLPTMEELYRQQRHPHFFQYPPVSSHNNMYDVDPSNDYSAIEEPQKSYGSAKGMVYEDWYPNTG